jgi:WD40 repeat protein
MNCSASIFHRDCRDVEPSVARFVPLDSQTAIPVLRIEGGNRMKPFCNADHTNAFMAFGAAPLLTYCGHSLRKKTPVLAVAWSADGSRIASSGCDSTVQVWDAGTGGNASTYRGHARGRYGVDAVAWSPDGRRIASAGTDQTLCVWDSATGGHLLTYRLQSGETCFDGVRANALAWSPDGSRIAFASYDGTVLVLRAE